MKALQCELCGGTDIIKDGDFFVCQNCGMKYTLESAKKMMVEGVVQVEGTVKADRSEEAKKYIELAKSAGRSRNFAESEKYAVKALEIDTTNPEAWLLKSIAIDWQDSVKNNRLTESQEAFINAYKLVTNSSDVTEERFHQLVSMLALFDKHLNTIVNSEIDYYCTLFKNSSGKFDESCITGSGLKIHLEFRESEFGALRVWGNALGNVKKGLAETDANLGDDLKAADSLIEKWTKKQVGTVVAAMYKKAGLSANSAVVDCFNNDFENRRTPIDYTCSYSIWILNSDKYFKYKDRCTRFVDISLQSIHWINKAVEHDSELVNSQDSLLNTIYSNICLYLRPYLDVPSKCKGNDQSRLPHPLYNAHQFPGTSLSSCGKLSWVLFANDVKTLAHIRDEYSSKVQKQEEEKQRIEAEIKETAIKEYWSSNPEIQNAYEHLPNKIEELEAKLHSLKRERDSLLGLTSKSQDKRRQLKDEMKQTQEQLEAAQQQLKDAKDSYSKYLSDYEQSRNA